MSKLCVKCDAPWADVSCRRPRRSLAPSKTTSTQTRTLLTLFWEAFGDSGIHMIRHKSVLQRLANIHLKALNLRSTPHTYSTLSRTSDDMWPEHF